ncbi:antitoxin VbhA family protein [Arthrobacter sp. CAU 1506]|uniref:antitoxin VbhA family protein n=1 Tax=Arthrobacter sp. CAU 1506 TaxID=2560052 RepID=UPI00197A74DB|nr:antitoxin VbhA family protein [Arthrobacter sp. CAU 1506]
MRRPEVLNSQQKRELTIDTMASWALEGMKPDRETVEDINSYIDGHMTLHEFIEKSKTL